MRNGKPMELEDIFAQLNPVANRQKPICEFELVHTSPDGRQRFYKSSLPIVMNAQGLNVSDELKKDMEALKAEYRDIAVDEIMLICISDAHTHIERLVFGALEYKGNFGRLRVQLGGKHTFMTEGGSEKSVYKDRTYLKHLCIKNNYKYKDNS